MIDTTITPITYKEAATLLLTGEGQIRTSVSNGLLTRLPTIGMKQTLIKEQVELFKGKKQIRLTLLSHDEMEQWQYFRHIAENKVPATTEHTYSQEEVAKLLASTMQQLSSMTEEEKKTLSTSLLLIGGLLALGLGISWFIEHRNEIAEKLIEYNNYVLDIDKQISDKIINSLKNLGEDTDVNTVTKMIEQTIKEVA